MGTPVMALDVAVTTKWLAARLATMIAPLVPAMELLAEAVAMIFCVPEVFRTAPKKATPLLPPAPVVNA